MSYNQDKTWDQISGSAGNYARTLINDLYAGLREYNEWQSVFADLGGSNAAVAASLGVTETAVAELNACYAALLALYNYANNQTPAQSDYFYSLRKFS